MIRILISGRLGNQLFQYAAARSQAKRLGVDLEIDPLFHQRGTLQDSYSMWLQSLPIRARIIHYSSTGPCSAHGPALRLYRKCIRPLFWRSYAQPPWGNDNSFFEIRPRTIVSGYFQSIFYLTPRDEEILSETDLWAVAPPQAAELARLIAKGSYTSIHVRKGDYLGYNDFNHIDYQCYSSAAMDLVRQKLGRTRFLVFSDDVEWCKKSGIFGGDCEFMEPNQFGDNPAIDLLLMSICSHHIVANSSYSWWAAWANLNQDKICILPKMWTRDRKTEAIGLVYPGWITL